jgi:DNA-binding MarR family transcriptional regulator
LSFRYDLLVARVETRGAEEAQTADTAREAWEQMRELTHNPQVLEKLHSLADEAGIIPGAAKALRFLSGPEPVPMRRLAQDLHCDNSYITTIVDSLEEAGVARREAHPTDRRIKVIVLTDAGRRLAALARELLGTPPRAFDSLSASETAVLRDLMRKLAEGADTSRT